MTSRERVLTALRHKEADKIPVDCGSMHSTGISAKLYQNYKQYKGIRGGHARAYDIVQQLAIPEDWYLTQNKIDVVDLARTFAEDGSEWHDFRLHDGTTVQNPNWIDIRQDGKSFFLLNGAGEKIAEMPPGSDFFDQTVWPYMDDDTEDFSDLGERMKQVMWTDAADPMTRFAKEADYYDRIRAHAKKLHETTEYAVTACFGASLFEMGCFLYRNDEMMINMMVEQERTEKFLDALTEMHMDNISKLVDAVAGYVDIIVVGDDLGTQNGPMIAPELYKKMIMPRAKKIYDIVKSRSDIKIFMHSCGAIYDFLPDIIEAGVDILNPVQTTAAGMDPVKLKKEFGKDLVFWGGGVDTQKTMLFGTPQQVEDTVLKNCEALMKDGGFVFAQIHNLLPGIPPENIDAMYRAVNRIYY